MSPPVDRIPGDDRLPAAAEMVVIGGGIIGVPAPARSAREEQRKPERAGAAPYSSLLTAPHSLQKNSNGAGKHLLSAAVV